MQLNVKTFDELTNKELYNILKLRSEVFVVEQKCNYVDMDDIDINSLHVFFSDDDKILAYLRTVMLDGEDNTAKIGRVISSQRRSGIGSKLLNEGKIAAKNILGAKKLIVDAQSYVKSFYEKSGFVQVSEEFLEVNIPHVKMELKL